VASGSFLKFLLQGETLKMNHRLIQALLCVLALASAAAGEGPYRLPQKGAADQNAGKKVEVCKLLTSAEIEGVQGSRVEESRPSSQPGGGLLFSQCLFRTSAPAMSVSIALASSAAQKPRDFWRKQFHAPAESEEHEAKPGKKDVRGGEEEEAARPRSIKGLGDEAYWVGGPVTGALYVLRRNTFIRISVGGVQQEPARIEKSVALARAALKRM
jgi:hypothetical protein